MRRKDACISQTNTCMSYAEEDAPNEYVHVICWRRMHAWAKRIRACHMRRRLACISQTNTCMWYAEEDVCISQTNTCMSYAEEDACISQTNTCMSYEEEDACISQTNTCMSYEEEDACISQGSGQKSSGNPVTCAGPARCTSSKAQTPPWNPICNGFFAKLSPYHPRSTAKPTRRRRCISLKRVKRPWTHAQKPLTVRDLFAGHPWLHERRKAWHRQRLVCAYATRVALVRVPFYFTNFLPTSLLYINILSYACRRTYL